MSRFLRSSLIRGALILSLAGATLVALPAAGAHAASCNPANKVVGDIDSDGFADLVVGVPAHNGNMGAVDIHYSGGSTQLVTRASLGGGGVAGDLFGFSTAVGDVNADGCDDLAIGAPGVNSQQGTVYVAYGSPSGIVGAAPSLLVAQTGAQLGYTVAINAPSTGSTATRPAVVLSGAPGFDVAKPAPAAAAADAGLVVAWLFTPTGTAGAHLITQDTAGVPDEAELGDRFGLALATSGKTIVVGAPYEAVGTVSGAGAVSVLKITSFSPFAVSGKTVNQNTSGVVDVAENFDLFGWSVAILGSRVAVGIPNETIGTAMYAGAVQLFSWSETYRTLSHRKFLHQDSSGVPGNNQSGDIFGVQVAFGRGLLTPKVVTLVVAAPFEDSALVDAGRVTMLEYSSSSGSVTRGKVFELGSGVPGTGGTGDKFGYSLILLKGDDAHGTSVRDSLAIGAPFWDAPGQANAGRLWWTGDWRTGWVDRHFSGGDLASIRYGYTGWSPTGGPTVAPSGYTNPARIGLDR